MRLCNKTGAASLVCIAPAGGEGPGEGEKAPTAGTLTRPSPWLAEGGANAWLPVRTYTIGHPLLRVCRSSCYGIL